MEKSIMTTKKYSTTPRNRKQLLPSVGTRWQCHFGVQKKGFRGRQSQWKIDRHQVIYSSARILSVQKHSNLETGSSFNYMRRYEIEIRFRCLHICFRGPQNQWNIDRHQVMYSEFHNRCRSRHASRQGEFLQNYTEECEESNSTRFLTKIRLPHHRFR